MQASHFWGEDLELLEVPSPDSGIDPWWPDRVLDLPASVLPKYYDLPLISGPKEGQQSVLRRLLTAPTEVVFHREYGAGLPSYVGYVGDVRRILSLVREQMLLESRVAGTPAPEVTLTQQRDMLFCQIQYADPDTGDSQLLAFDVGR